MPRSGSLDNIRTVQPRAIAPAFRTLTALELFGHVAPAVSATVQATARVATPPLDAPAKICGACCCTG
jgi:hypothetical protein